MVRVPVLVALLGAASATAGLAGCASGGGVSARAPALRPFVGQDLSFRYPASWQARRYGVPSTRSRSIVYLSNDELRTPCVTRRGTNNTTITCRQPVTRLRRRSILAWWSKNGNPAWNFEQAAGAPTVVGGRHAKLIFRSTDCGVGADTVLDVVVQIPRIADNWYEFIACMRGPGIPALERQAWDLLNTVSFAGS